MKPRRKPDYYSKRAKIEGYKSRAAYKLLDMQQRFQIISKGDYIIDLCGAPGGFSQIAQEFSGDTGKVLLVDIDEVEQTVFQVKGARVDILRGDITEKTVKDKIFLWVNLNTLGHTINLVMADCSPNVGGNWATDHSRQIWLAENALEIAVVLQAQKLVCKIFQGEYTNEFTESTKKWYSTVRCYKPPVSRKTSAEQYLVAKNFHVQQKSEAG